jgi:chromosome segregation ATPase
MSEDPTKDLTEDLPTPEPALPNTTDSKLDWLIREMRQMRTDFNALNQKVEDRLHDTRPIWQAVQAQLDKLTREVESQSNEITEIKQGLRRLERKMELLNKAFFERQTDQDELLERVEKLEDRLAS